MTQQTYGDYEIVIVDDGSTDGTSELCDDYAKRFKQIKLIHQENHGVSYTRNQLLQNASGQWIIFVDADDHVAPQYLQSLHHAIITNPVVDLFCCDFYNVGRAGEKYVKCGFNSTRDYLNKMFAGRSGKRALWAKAIKADLIAKTQVLFEEDITMGEDFLFISKILTAVSGIGYIPQGLYCHNRANPRSITLATVVPRTEDKLKYLERMVGFYKQKGLYDDYKRDFYNLYFMIFVEYYIYRSKSKEYNASCYEFPQFEYSQLYMYRRVYKLLIMMGCPILLRAAVRVLH